MKDMSGAANRNPPVFVLNAYYSGLGIARNLHGRGIDVYSLSFDSSAPGFRSRFFKGTYDVPNGRDEPDALFRRLLEIRQYHDANPVIFATRDFDVLFLNEYRDRLGPHFRVPQNCAVPVLMDKMELAKIARAHDIETPVTVACSSNEELESHIPVLRFPVVVKPRFAHQWRAKGAWQTVGARKAFLVGDADQLRREYRQLSTIGPEILIQEYISGEDTDIVVCAGYVNEQHDLVAYFTAKKLRQSPPLFGTGCVVEALDVPAIVPITRRLLRVCRYTGLAEVEFKHDQSSGTYSLIEVNPRHWDQHELGTMAGINLSWVAYQESIGQNASPQVPNYSGGTQYKWIAESEMLMLLLRNAYTRIHVNPNASLPSKLAGYLSAVRASRAEACLLLRGRRIYATFHSRDPVPGLLLCLRTLRDIAGIVMRRLVRAGSVQHRILSVK